MLKLKIVLLKWIQHLLRGGFIDENAETNSLNSKFPTIFLKTIQPIKELGD